MPSAYDLQEERQVLELRFDTVAGIDIWTEAIIDAGELAELAPDRAEGRECRLVTLRRATCTHRRTAAAAVGVGQHLPDRGELVVFAGAREPRDRSPEAET